jgi:predicted dehydrogenase
MVNWFIAGHKIPDDHWYFAESEGGRVLGNLCHWIDSSLHIVGPGMFPCELIPSSPPESRSDFALTMSCADGSIVNLTFSAKGHTFEGVREVLSLHRGDALVLLRDFEETRLQRGASSRVHRTMFRDHGHEANIRNSFRGGTAGGVRSGETLSYVMNSARLSLAAREALESGKTVSLEAWQD